MRLECLYLKKGARGCVTSADALRIVALAYRSEREKRKEKPVEADSLAEEELARCRKIRDRRGEAVIPAMLEMF